MRNITILGAGFAALTAIRNVRKTGYYDGEITLISPKASFFYFPSLIWIPSGRRTEADLTIPLDNFFKRMNVKHIAASVTGLEPDNKKVLTDKGKHEYEYLLIASGGRFIKKAAGIEHVYTPCEGYAVTKAYSDKLSAMDGGILAFGFGGNPKEPSAMRGGPVFEFLLGVDTLLRQQGRRDKFELVFFSPSAEPGKRMGAAAVKDLLKEMQKRDIRTHLGNKIKGFTKTSFITEGGEEHSDLTLFMPGMTGPAWADNSGLPLSNGGFIQSNKQCQVPDVENVFVAGDAGSYPGPDWMPKQAHIADLQAEAAIKNMVLVDKDQTPTHTFKVELICIVDALNTGIMVFRSPQRAFRWKSKLFHWSKRLFEWSYLRPYR